jgi:hypothetical protein
MELGEIGRALVTPQQLAHHIPGKLRKREGEKYMIDILNDPTK